MENLLVQARIRDLLERKAAMLGGGEYMDMMGEGVYAGARRRKRGPTAFNRKVASYMRKHGVTLGEAAHALRGSGEGEGYRRKRRKKPVKRRRYGRGEGVLVGGKRRSSAIPRSTLALTKKLDALEEMKQDVEAELGLCNDKEFDKYQFANPSAKLAAMKRCGRLPSQVARTKKEKAIYDFLKKQ